MSAETVKQLKRLGRTMADCDDLGPPRLDDPAVYTYSGSSSTTTSPSRLRPRRWAPRCPRLVAPRLVPQDLAEIRDELRNVRSATLDLDSLYNAPAPPDPADGARMKIGKVSDTGTTNSPFKKPKGKDQGQRPAAPRPVERPVARPRGLDRRPAQRREHDHRPIASGVPEGPQRAGRRGAYPAQARRVLRQHYQHIVVHDYLKRIVDPGHGRQGHRPGRQQSSTHSASRSSCRWSSRLPRSASGTP